MWNTAAEPAVRGQLLAGVAAVSLIAPQSDPRMPSSCVAWDRCLLEESLGQTAEIGFHVTEADLHHVWMGQHAGAPARFRTELFITWLRENKVKLKNSSASVPARQRESGAHES